MKGRFFWIALVLIGISWTLNTIYAHSKQLSAPIFLDHYVDTVIEEHRPLTFYYLTNKNDFSGVSHVNIGDVTGYVSNNEFEFGFDFDSNPNIDEFTHHALRSIQLELNPTELENALKDGSFTFNEIDVFFQDGRNATVSIGEVTIHSEYPTDNGLDSLSSSGSSDGDNEYVYKAEEALSIERISVNFEDILGDHLFIKIHSSNNPTHMGINSDWNTLRGTDIQEIKFPYKLEKDERLYIYTQIPPDFIGSLDSSITFSGTTESKNKFTAHIPFYSQQPYLEQRDVNRIIKEKSGGDIR